MIMTLSRRLAAWTAEWNPQETLSREALVYQYAVTLNLAAIIVPAAIVGALTGRLGETMTAAVAFMGLRAFSGGFHFRSLDLCAVVTAAIFVIIPYLAPLVGGWETWITVGAAGLVARKAPTSLNNTRWDIRNKIVTNTFKCIATLIVISNLFVGSAIMALAFAVQALLLLPREEVTTR